MGGTPVKIGPFNGGLNSYSQPNAIGDNEVANLVNFDIDFDGSLYSRAPITVMDQLNNTAYTGIIVALGWFIDTNGDRYFIFMAGTSLIARNEENGAYTTIQTSITVSAIVQYASKLWFVATDSSTSTGGSWSPATGRTNVTTMPRGTTATLYKERMFIGGGTAQPNRVYFSNPADLATWTTTTDFFDVKSGDGDSVTYIYSFQDVVACFKKDSTYLFSYDSNPSRGVVRQLSGSIGAENGECVVEYTSSLYVLHETTAYQVSNWTFTPINVKVPFVPTATYAGYSNRTPTLGLMSDRLVFSMLDSIYVFNLRMGVWTQWTTTESRIFRRFIEVPRRYYTDQERYYSGGWQATITQTNHGIFEWRPEPDTVRSETIACSFDTKVYDFNVPYTFKRLFWWGIDGLVLKDITTVVHPTVYAPAVSHATLNAYNHNQITGTHLRPLSVVLDITEASVITSDGAYRMFIKFIKSLRFRQISFTLSSTVDGTTSTGPLRVYSVIAIIDNKQKTANKIN